MAGLQSTQFLVNWPFPTIYWSKSYGKKPILLRKIFCYRKMVQYNSCSIQTCSSPNPLLPTTWSLSQSICCCEQLKFADVKTLIPRISASGLLLERLSLNKDWPDTHRDKTTNLLQNEFIELFIMNTDKKFQNNLSSIYDTISTKRYQFRNRFCKDKEYNAQSPIWVTHFVDIGTKRVDFMMHQNFFQHPVLFTMSQIFVSHDVVGWRWLWWTLSRPPSSSRVSDMSWSSSLLVIIIRHLCSCEQTLARCLTLLLLVWLSGAGIMQVTIQSSVFIKTLFRTPLDHSRTGTVQQYLWLEL